MPNYGSMEWKFQQMKRLTDEIVASFSESENESERDLAAAIKCLVNDIESTRERDA